MRILSVGTFSGLSNTCLHRHWALERVAEKVDKINTSAPKLTIFVASTTINQIYEAIRSRSIDLTRSSDDQHEQSRQRATHAPSESRNGGKRC